MKHCFSSGPILRRFFKKSNLNHGYSLIEVLIASAIILTNLGVISSAVVQYGEVSRKQRIMTLAMNVESALHQAVSDPATYLVNDPDLIDAAFPAGQPYMEFMISTNFPPQPPADTTAPFFTLSLNATTGTAINVQIFPFDGFYTEKLDPCLGPADFTNRNCVIQLEIDRRQITLTPPTYAFAYRIRINPNLQIQTQNLGVSQNDAFTTARPVEIGVGTKSDYNLYVPQYLLMTNNQTLCSNAATGLTVGLTGFDSNTGRAHCIQRPEVGNACLPNEMAKGLRIVPSGANFRMVLICAPIQQFTCGLPNSNANHEDYSFRTLNATYFDSDVYPISPGGPPAAPRCVFTSESPSTYSATFSSAANMRSGTSPNVCPPRYNVTGGCSATGVNQVSGGSCTCCTSQDFYGVCNGWSTHTWNHTTYSVTTTPSNTLYPGNESVTCTLNETTPANPACFTCPFGQTAFSSPSIRGTMHFQPTCALEIPSTPLEIDAVGL